MCKCKKIHVVNIFPYKLSFGTINYIYQITCTMAFGFICNMTYFKQKLKKLKITKNTKFEKLTQGKCLDVLRHLV